MRKRTTLSACLRLDVNVGGALFRGGGDQGSHQAHRGSALLQQVGLNFVGGVVRGVDVAAQRTAGNEFHAGIARGGGIVRARLGVFLAFGAAIKFIDGLQDFFAESKMSNQFHAQGKAQLVDHLQVLRFGDHQRQFRIAFHLDGQRAAALGQRLGNQAQDR